MFKLRNKKHTNQKDFRMRETRNAQSSIFDFYSQHPLGQQLKALSDLLDNSPFLLELIEQDFRRPDIADTGASGLSVESAFRCLLLKQILQVSFDKLSFHLSDSITYRTFTRLEADCYPSRSGLHLAIRSIKAETLEQTNGLHLSHLIEDGVISVDKLRIDSTVTASNIASPSDSQLLADSIRVLSRLMSQSKALTGVKIRFTDQRKKSKSLSYRIFNAKKAEKDNLYPQLLSCASRVFKQSSKALDRIKGECEANETTQHWIDKIEHFRTLLLRVIDQTQRRVYLQESVPSPEKIVSIFEPHTDIIVKGEQDVQFGHKINLATQEDGFITYLNIEKGNPADVTLYQPVLQACKADYQQLPSSVVADGCYASQDNANHAKANGVKRNVFSKPVGLSLTDMGVKKKTYDALRDFRAGVEGNISEFKRAFGADKATWKGQEGFNAFVWASTLCYNLVRAVRFSSA